MESTPGAAASATQQGSVFTQVSPLDPQAVSTTAISPRRIDTTIHGAYLWLTLYPGTTFYGGKVTNSD